MIKKIFIISFVLFSCFDQPVFAQENSPIVVELFTSEFCPACPPADRYLEKLSEQDNVIALGCHVTYFKRQSKLGQQFCSQRQFVYGQSLKERGPYTPQFVLNGRRAVVGTRTEKVAAALVQASADKIGQIVITLKAQNVFHYQLPEIKRGSYEIMLVTYLKPQRAGRSSFVNAVDKVMRLGLWDGARDTRIVYPDIDNRHQGFALIVQDKRSSAVVAAGQYRF